MSYNALTNEQRLELWNKYHKYDLEMLLTQLANKEKRVKELEAELKECKKQQASKEVKESNKKLREERARLYKTIETLTSGLEKAKDFVKQTQNNNNNPQA